MKTVGNCDLCGQPVEDCNDSTRFTVILEMVRIYGDSYQLEHEQAHRDDDWMIVLRRKSPRHLLPVDGCKGSPSRAQYLPCQPKDTREDATFYPEAVPSFRIAYGILLLQTMKSEK